MIKNSVFAVLLLTFVWVILRESLAVSTIATGVVLSVGCVYFCRKFLPLPKTSDIRLFMFALYLPFLLGQVYIAGFSAIKLLITGARVEVVEVKTTISNLFLRTVLCNSITLVPGSVSLEMKDDTITVLWLIKKTQAPEYSKRAQEVLLCGLERMLRRAEG